MEHEDSAHGDDQDKINAHVVYLYRCAKLSLPVYAESLSDEQRKIAKQHLVNYKKENCNKKP